MELRDGVKAAADSELTRLKHDTDACIWRQAFWSGSRPLTAAAPPGEKRVIQVSNWPISVSLTQV